MSTALTMQSRDRALAAMTDAEGVDVLVVGGGVTGAGIALDAATRGLKTAIVEAQDWASGTSQPVQPAGARRPALPLQPRLRPRRRGAQASAVASWTHARPTWSRRSLPVAPEDAGHRARYSAVGVGIYDVLAQIGGRRHEDRPGPEAPTVQEGRQEAVPRRPRRRPHRCDRVLRRARRRRPPGHQPGAQRRRFGALAASRTAGGGLRQGCRRPRHRRPHPRPETGRRTSTSRPRPSSTPPACGPRQTQAMAQTTQRA
jgi:glycine/D-amino acid oxidase-like deaminating enzyme